MGDTVRSKTKKTLIARKGLLYPPCNQTEKERRLESLDYQGLFGWGSVSKVL